MASFRDLVSGGGACAVPEASSSSSSSSNPLGALANTLLGSSSKTQEKLRELPAQTTTGPILSVTGEDGLTSLPGSEIDKLQYPDAQSSEFLQNYYAAENGNLSDVWDGIERVTPYPGPHVGLRPLHNDRPANIYGSGSPFPQPMWEGAPQNVVSHVLHSFWDSIRAGIPFQPVALPTLGLSSADKQCIIDRTAIMSRHIFADKSDEYIDSQVNALLHSLDIDNDFRGKVHERGRYPELEEYWTESQGASNLVTSHTANRWVDEFDQSRPPVDPGSWADAFEQQHGVNGWVSQYQQEQQMESAARLRGTNIPNLAAMEHSRLLVETLAQNEDPRFQHSKFLQFVSKMSRGELIIDDNQVKPLEPSSNWAEEYHQQYDRNPETWANQYTNGQSTSDAWAGEFATEHDRHTSQEDQWANEFSKLNMQDWADEFSSQFAEGAFDSSADNWVDSYEKFLEKELTAGQQRSDSSRSMYVFADQNPYVGHSNPLKVGQELFRKGLLSEAVLALEAEVLKNPDNAEGWRLLGITHAENDDDQQAISSMMRAMEVDPNNLEVLLALGVSYTNELEQSAALKYLYKWLQNHPKYGALIPPEQMAQLHYDDVNRLFNEAVQLSPDDADIHIVLGVMYNISRQYDKAIASFQKALKLKPRDYSLWNKLGATQANSVQSSDAIDAYQRALDLKPNYVRAWANMGISFANQGRYEESISYYVRALSMNPKADNTWEYLRISLSCASREDLLEACSSRNLELLQKQFPL